MPEPDFIKERGTPFQRNSPYSPVPIHSLTFGRSEEMNYSYPSSRGPPTRGTVGERVSCNQRLFFCIHLDIARYSLEPHYDQLISTDVQISTCDSSNQCLSAQGI